MCSGIIRSGTILLMIEDWKRSVFAFSWCMKTRRETLKLALASAAGTLTASAAQPIASRIIDTHTHFYDPKRPQGVPWPPPNTALYRPVYPKDWAALANPLGIRETVVVEASKLVEDNDWILNLAAKENAIIGFVGNLQPADSDFAANVNRLAANRIFRGIRVSGKALSDNAASSEFIAGGKLLANLNLSLDVNGLPDMSIVAALAAKVPELRIVIDHCGGCGDPQNLKQGWKDGMAACTKAKNIFVKVSGLPEQSGAPEGKAVIETEHYLPVLDFLWDRFGADRLIYGSNWPVSERGAEYAGVFKMVSGYFSTKGSEACEKYFWKNSLAAYHWIERK
jgi:predicted TIM-barrel fold metal-dependent hydrolase